MKAINQFHFVSNITAAESDVGQLISFVSLSVTLKLKAKEAN